MLDFSTVLGRRASERLAADEVIWLVTVGADGTPQPNPVWFFWEGGAFLIYTKPDSRKVEHIRRSARVALHFDGGPNEDVIVFTGRAELDVQAPAESAAAYLAKYSQGIARIGLTVESFSSEYALTIRVTPDRLRGL